MAVTGEPSRWAEVKKGRSSRKVLTPLTCPRVPAAGLVLGGSVVTVAGINMSTDSGWSAIGLGIATIGTFAGTIGFMFLVGKVVIDGGRVKSRWPGHSRSASIASVRSVYLDVKTLWGYSVWVPVMMLHDGSEIGLVALSMPIAWRSSRKKTLEVAVALREQIGVSGSDRG